MDEPIFTKRVSAGTRVYYIDARIDRKGQKYISLSEIPTDKSPGKKERQRIFIHAKNMKRFAKAFAKVATYIKNDAKDDPLVLLGWSCPYCGAPTKLVDDTEIYGRSYGTSCYVCKPCGAWVGCHKGTDKALGRIANKELRELKRQAHESFDLLWKEGCLPRAAAYEVLSAAFGLPTEQTHIGMFDEDMCRKVISLSNIILKYIKSDG